MQLAFYFNQNRCIGCNTCSVACKDWNMLQPGPVRPRTLHIIETEEKFPNVNYVNLPYSCNHCENPACVNACSNKAIIKRESDGIVVVDKRKCTGLLQCVAACPFSAIKIMDDRQEPVSNSEWGCKHPAVKCTFCWDRLEEGSAPVCVASCTTRALDYGPIDELMKKYPDAVRANSSNLLGFPDSTKDNSGNELTQGDTKPCFLVSPKKTTGIVDISQFKPELF